MLNMVTEQPDMDHCYAEPLKLSCIQERRCKKSLGNSTTIQAPVDFRTLLYYHILLPASLRGIRYKSVISYTRPPLPILSTVQSTGRHLERTHYLLEP